MRRAAGRVARACCARKACRARAASGPPLVNAALMNSLMFVVFAECRRMLPDNAFGAFASGAIAGVATATLSTPFDYLKIQAQVRGSRPLAVLGATRPGVLFRGHAMNMLREGVFTCV